MGRKLTIILLTLAIGGTIAGCHSKRRVEPVDSVKTYDQPSGPTSGLVKIYDVNDDDAKDNIWWYWFEFMDSNHQIKEYRVCATSDYIPKGMAGNISLTWTATDNCFAIASFNRREEEEDK